MAEHYTDEDVERGKEALGDALWRHLQAVTSSGTELTRAVLDAVAPAIAARALREFAERVESPAWTHRDDWNVNCAYAFEIRARADEIEGR